MWSNRGRASRSGVRLARVRPAWPGPPAALRRPRAPGLDQPGVHLLGLRAREVQLVGLGAVERQHQQQAMIEMLYGLMEKERCLIAVSLPLSELCRSSELLRTFEPAVEVRLRFPQRLGRGQGLRWSKGGAARRRARRRRGQYRRRAHSTTLFVCRREAYPALGAETIDQAATRPNRATVSKRSTIASTPLLSLPTSYIS